MKKNEIIYLDNSATTQVSKEVFEAMKPYYTSEYFNPDSLYYQAREVKKEIEKVRELIAEEIHADPDEIFFTSGGCEANTWAIKIFKDKGYEQILTTPIEHHSILNAAEGYFNGQVIYAPLSKGDMIKEILHESDVISNGRIDIDQFEFMLKRLSIQGVSIMHGNNEIGTMQDIGLLCDMCKEYNIAFHTDTVQTFMHTPIDVDDMGVDMLSASAHKIGGPKGVGFLYIRKSYQNNVKPLVYGGQQEQGLRGGTTNVPGIIGFGKAIELNLRNKNKLFTNRNTYDIIESALLNAKGLDLMFTGSVTKRIPNHISMCFRNIKGQDLIPLLAEKGIICSTGSACNSESLVPSYVLQAINIPDDFIHGAVRLTYSNDITKEEIKRVVEAIEDSISILRTRG